MSARRRERRSFSDGPPKWTYTSYGILLATAHLGLAGFDVGKFFPLWDAAWSFYSTLILITSGSAVAIHLTGRKPDGAKPPGG